MADSNSRRPRLLATIASFGVKNLGYLKRVIQSYHSMTMDVDVVVFSDAPKELGPRVKVIVGLPTKNPWSLPFAHKPYLAANIEAYDLFIYSEDDAGVTERHIEAFLEITPLLAPTEIAGYLRYEEDKNGNWSFPEIHGMFHWKPDSVCRRANHVVAEFDNEHAAFFLLTQAQLRKVIASGGFLRAPIEGRYDLACTAATDPYTNCGFRKVVSVTAWKDFSMHHLPNRYVGQLGLPMTDFRKQIDALIGIANGTHPSSSLCETETRISQGTWSKSYYEPPCEKLLALVPPGTRTVLSIGCGSGEMEKILLQRGMTVTALPLDSVIGSVAADLGLEIVHGTLPEGLAKLGNRRFDTILISNLLHLLRNPIPVIDRCAKLLSANGAVLVAGPNFEYLPVQARRFFGDAEYRKLREFSSSNVNPFSLVELAGWFQQAGLDLNQLTWQAPPAKASGSSNKRLTLRGAIARAWQSVNRTGMEWDEKIAARSVDARSSRTHLRPGRWLASDFIARFG